MFKQRSSQRELMDDLDLAGKELEQNLDELAFINRYLGGNDVVTNALQKITEKYPSKKEWAIQDMGSGGGDLLEVMARWMRKRKMKAQLTGVDANAFMINYAQNRTRDFPEIDFKKADVFDAEGHSCDIMVFSLFCHHFSDEELVRMWSAARLNARVAVVINDLHRHWLAWASIWVLTRLFRGSYLVQHDAPLSVLRAFTRPELRLLLEKAGIKDAQIKWKWAFRFQIIFSGAASENN